MTDFDVAVIGAGPAGAIAARELSAAGASVLLIDRVHEPVDKVCGGCLHPAAVRALIEIGLEDLLVDQEAVPVGAAELRMGPGRVAEVALPAGGLALTRRSLDGALRLAAVASGAELRAGQLARVAAVEADCIRLLVGAELVDVRVVVLARGLAPARDGEPGPRTRPDPRSRVGFGAVAETHGLAAGRVIMSSAPSGYVGMVGAERGRLILAAAVDPRAIRGRPPAVLIEQLLREAGTPVPVDLSTLSWRGTPPITCAAPSAASRRIFAIGDAAGYVEPFTGEGMAWAIQTAREVAPLVLQAVDHWTEELPARWDRLRRDTLGRRPARCRATSALFHHPRIAGAILPWISRLGPRWIEPLVRVAYAGSSP